MHLMEAQTEYHLGLSGLGDGSKQAKNLATPVVVFNNVVLGLFVRMLYFSFVCARVCASTTAATTQKFAKYAGRCTLVSNNIPIIIISDIIFSSCSLHCLALVSPPAALISATVVVVPAENVELTTAARRQSHLELIFSCRHVVCIYCVRSAA